MGVTLGFPMKVKSSEVTAVMERHHQEVMKANGKVAVCFHWWCFDNSGAEV